MYQGNKDGDDYVQWLDSKSFRNFHLPGTSAEQCENEFNPFASCLEMNMQRLLFVLKPSLITLSVYTCPDVTRTGIFQRGKKLHLS